LFILPKSSFVEDKFYAPQKKILETRRLTRTNISGCAFDQPPATRPLFFDNLHFEHLDKSVNHKSTLKYLSKCSKWRLSKKRGRVAGGCFRRTFQWCEYTLWATTFGSKFYAPQTKILERMTKEEIRIFEALFKGVSTRFGLRTIEKCFENPDFLFCHSFQNLRLGGVNFAR